MWRVIVAIGLVATALVVTPSATLACSCVMMTPEEHLREADAAFVGLLVSREDPRGGSSAEEVAWTFRVEQVAKGELEETIEVMSPVEPASCGFQLRDGARAGILLNRGNGTWHGSMCSVISADAMLASASETYLPLPAATLESEPALPDEGSAVSLGWIIAAMLAAIAAGGFVFCRWRWH
jgi:hypothetical protein